MKRQLKRFDIILVDFGETLFAGEQGGIRPALIIQNDIGNIHSSTTIVMPITSKIKNIRQPTHTLLIKDASNGLTQNSMILGECMRQISERRILKYLGSVSDIDEKREIKRVYDANFGEVA